MTRGVAARPARGAVAALGLAGILAGVFVDAPAHAGSLVVREADGSQWSADDDPAADANDYLLRHLGPGGAPDPRFGRDGQAAFTLDLGNDAPASVRVDGARRIWIVGAGLAGNQPQPVVARFLPDGAPDLRWGVQGKVQLSPNALAVRPNDLLPLADGSVLVAGVDLTRATPRAVVFHLNADGSLDRRFADAGVWRRAGDDDAASATSLAAGADGGVAAAVAVRGAKPAAELWAMAGGAPALLASKPLDDGSDGEDLHASWAGDHWRLDTGVGSTSVVGAASLAVRAQAGVAAATPSAASSAASDPGQGGFNPFAADPASAAEPSAEPGDDGSPPWAWIAAGALLLGAAIAAFVRGRGKAARTHATRR